MKRRPMSVNNIVLAIVAGWMVAFLAPAPGQTTHIVASGDSLDSIGRQHGVSAAEIAAVNAIENPALIQPGQTLKIPAGGAATASYTIKPGDTLGEIAASRNTSTEAIAALNNIADPKKLQVGQTIQLPAPVAGEPARSATATSHQLPSDLKRILDATPVKSGRWRHIVVHHSGTPNGSLKGMDMYHRQKRRMENGLAYHFVIGNGRGMPDGKIEIGNRWKRQIKGGHLSSERQNSVALGICLVGNFESHKPTEAQMRSLIALTTYLMNRCGIPKSRVETHREINVKPTACPGRYFPEKKFHDGL